VQGLVLELKEKRKKSSGENRIQNKIKKKRTQRKWA